MSPATFLPHFSKEVDLVPYERLTPADHKVIQSDPVLKNNYLRHFGDFRTDYLLFDTFTAPFNDIRVRKAFAYALDRKRLSTMSMVKSKPCQHIPC